jgi:chemotaxis signal transduction protein
VGWVPGSEGDKIPVFSLVSQLGRLPSIEERGGSLQRIIVLNPSLSTPLTGESDEGPQPEGSEGWRLWALLVDRVSQVIQVPADCVVPLPPIAVSPSANYFEGVVKLGGEEEKASSEQGKASSGLVLLLSPERLHPGAPTSVGQSQAEASSGQDQASSGQGEVPPGEVGAPLAPRLPTAALGQHPHGPGGRRHSQGQIMVFSVADPRPGEQPLSFGLSISQINEILYPLPLLPVPGAPPFVLGLVNWRDRPVPAIDLGARLGLAPEASPSASGRNRLIIVRDKGHALPVTSLALPAPACTCRRGTGVGAAQVNPVEGEGSLPRKGANQGVLVSFLIQPTVRALRLPLPHQPCSRALPLDQALTRGVVELENETLVIPDIRGMLP